MKNIHVLPTDKPSRLHLWTDENGSKLALCDLEYSHTRNTQNIYITSFEYIKDVDWMIRGNEQPIKVTKDFFWDFGVRYYKIILTTDQDLINDGVQAIDDEFLEWFIKNPSCEEVEVRKIEDELISSKNPKIRFNALQDFPSFISAESLNNMIITYKYKIIIPKEEPKQTDENGKPLTYWGGLAEHKQETLEETAVRIYDDNLFNYEKYRAGFIEGAKWQQEETIKEVFEWLTANNYVTDLKETLIDNFNKFKQL